MKNLLPVVSVATAEQRAKTLIDSCGSPDTAKEASTKEMELIKEENPIIHKVIGFYSSMMGMVFGDLAGSMCKVYIVSIYLLLRLQAESDRMEEEIKL